jgi:hypothetical protein
MFYFLNILSGCWPVTKVILSWNQLGMLFKRGEIRIYSNLFADHDFSYFNPAIMAYLEKIHACFNFRNIQPGEPITELASVNRRSETAPINPNPVP